MRRTASSHASSAFLLFTPRFVISAGITAFFGLMMFLLWKREAGLDFAVRGLGISPDFLTATWIDYDHWMWIERGDTRIGAYVIQMRRNEEEELPRYEFIARARMIIDAFSLSVPVELDMDVAMNDGFELETFQGRLLVSGQLIQVEGFTEDLKLYFRMKGPEPFVTGGGFVSVSPLGKPVMLAAAVRPVITQSADLKVGKKWKTRASDPLTGRAEVLVTVEVEALETIEIGGEQVRAFRIVERTGQMATTSWYDEDGQILKSDLGNGLVLVRGPRKVISEQFPEFELPPQFDPIDHAAIRREADEQGGVKMTNLLPWWPNL